MKKMSCCPQSSQLLLLAASVGEGEVRGRAYSQLQRLAESSVPTGNQVEEAKAQRHQLREGLRLPPCPLACFSPHELSPQPRAPAAPVSHGKLTQAAPLYLCSGHKLPAGGSTEPLRWTLLWVPCALPASNQLSRKAVPEHRLGGFQGWFRVGGSEC